MPADGAVRRAVVLAAGEGSRLRASSGGVPKPLARVGGVALLERAVEAALAAGLRELVVVTGAEGERVEAALSPSLSRRAEGRGARLRWVSAPDWRLGNGRSLLAAPVDPPFLVLMADHVLSPEVLAAALRAPVPAASEAALVVDGRLSRFSDREVLEATRVRREAGRIAAIGKGLRPFDALDVGVFVDGGGLVSALAELARREPGRPLAVTDGAACLAATGRLRPVELRAGWWIDVDDGPALRRAEAELLREARRSGGDGLVARHLNRRLSGPLTRALARAGVAPDQATLLSFGLALASALLFASGHPGWGGLLAQAASVVDGTDGELARLRLLARPQGAFLDTVLDRYADAFLVAGLAFGALRAGAEPALSLGLGLAALAGVPMSALMKDRLLVLGLLGHGGRFDPARDDPAWLRAWPANRDGRLLLVCVLGLLGLPLLALLALAVVSHVLAVGRLLAVLRRASAERAILP